MERHDRTMMHAGESRIPVLKTRRATGESVYRPTPRSTPPTSTRPRANTGAASMESKKLGFQSPPLTPHPPMPSPTSLAIPKSKADYRISDLIADPNFNPFKPSTPPTFSPSMESSLNILGNQSAHMKGTSLSPPLSPPSESPEPTPSATMRGHHSAGRKPPTARDPLPSQSQLTWSRDTSTASPESISSATMESGFGRAESPNFHTTEHGPNGSAASMTHPRPNHDDMILPVVAKKIKAGGLPVHNVVAYGEGEDAPLYRVRDTPSDPSSSQDRLKTTPSPNVAKQTSINDTSIPSSPEPTPPTPPLPAQQGPTNRRREPPNMPGVDQDSSEPSSPTSHYHQQQLPSPPRSSQDIQSPTRPPRAQRPPRHTATAALADQMRQEEIALQERHGARWNEHAHRDERNMEYLHDAAGGAGYDHLASQYNQDSNAYNKDVARRTPRMQREQEHWDNHEPPIPVPSRRPVQQHGQAWPSQSHDAYGAQDHSYSSYDHQQHPSTYQDSQQMHPYHQQQQQQHYQKQLYQQQQQQANQGRLPQSATPQLHSSNYYPQQTHPHSSIDMPVKPEQQQDGQRLSAENAAPTPKKKKNALCCIIC